MTIRNPTEAERQGLIDLKVEEIRASYGRGLPSWRVVAALLGMGVAVTLLLLELL